MLTTFLSLSGHDEFFVKGVHARLPDGLSYFYPISFENGENLIEAMQERIGQATVFALFASSASAKSHWVNFELERARIQKIVDHRFRVFVFPIDRRISRDDLPGWMSEYWIPNAGMTQNDIARYLRNSSAFHEILNSPAGTAYGRGELRDNAIVQFTNHTVSSEKTPNILIFAGLNGIGRRTFCREFLASAFPAAPNLKFGPLLSLPQFADIDDVYRALRQELDPDFSVVQFEPDRQDFLSSRLEDQVSEVLLSLGHFFSLGQAVTIVTSNGIFEDQGTLKRWVQNLFSEIALLPQAKLIIISDRQVHDNELRKTIIPYRLPYRP